ncbi:MAG: GIY-YIG nuclease family protein [Methyloceanibacter sp.]
MDDDILRDLRPPERRKWLRQAKAEVVRRNIQERIDEIAQAVEDRDEDFAELLLNAFREDIKPFIGLSERQRQNWVQRAELAMQPHRGEPDENDPRIYFISTDDEFIKIGFTTNLRERIRSLRTASPKRLRVHVAIPGTRDDERELHRRFAVHHVRGEWFKFSDAIADFIASYSD